MTFHLTCVHINFSSVSVTEWPTFGKKLITRLILVISRFGFEGWSWVLIASCLIFVYHPVKMGSHTNSPFYVSSLTFLVS